MADYKSLGSLQLDAAPDETGLNPGNLTTAFTVAVLPTIAQYEIYRAVVTSVPAGATAVITIGIRPVSFTAPGFGGGSEWDPNEAPEITKGQEIYFLWTAAAAATPVPKTTIWLRYDTSLPANKG